MSTRRTATRADIAPMWDLRTRAVRQSCASHYPADVIATWSASPAPAGYTALIDQGGAVLALENGQLLGYAIANLETGEIDAVFVDPAAAGRGLGKQLLGACEDLATARGFGVLFVYASLNAVPFYQAAGFRFVRDERYAHPSGISLACVYMEKRGERQA